MKKESVLKTLEEFPEEFPLEALIERLIFIEKIEEALEDVRENRLASHEEVKKEFYNK